MKTQSTMLVTVFALSFAAAGVVSAEGGDTYTDTDASAENLVQQGITAKDIVKKNDVKRDRSFSNFHDNDRFFADYQ